MEIQPDGNPVAPIIPPKSTLVITQVCVTAAFPTGGAVTLYVQSHNITSKLAVCTLHPDKGIFHWAVQLLFSGSVTLFLVPTNPNLPCSGSQQKKAGKKGAAGNSTSQEEAAAEAKELVQLPTVHIMGYYEAEDEGDDEDEEEEDEEDASDDGEFVSSARGGRGRGAGARARGATNTGARGRGRR